MKHPLLPDSYTDRAIHTALLSALRPYERMPESGDPHYKWDLAKAWLVAKPLLQHAYWRSYDDATADSLDVTWELSADSDQETETLNAIIAGIVAYQIEHEDGELVIRRVEYRKGGEIGLIVSHQVQQKLLAMFPKAKYEKCSPDDRKARK